MPCVNAYAVTREWGGPEEGGWWWNLHRPIAFAAHLTEAEAEKIKAIFEDLYKDQAEGDIYSVLGGVEIHVSIEDEPFESATKEKPIYC